LIDSSILQWFSQTVHQLHRAR